MTASHNPVEYFSQMQANTGWRRILESFARFVNPESGARLMDVGAGPGALTYHFYDHYHTRTAGIDIDPHMMQRARELYAVDGLFITGGLPWLPLANNVFDYATATNVLYLLPDPEAGCREMARVIRPGGTLAILNPSEHMTGEAAEQLIAERQLTGFARDNFRDWAALASQNPRWTEADIMALFAQADVQLVESRLRIGAGLVRYARGIKVDHNHRTQ